MKNKLYSVYDEVAQHYHPPFVQANDQVARRSFMMLCRTPESDIGKSPRDFRLFFVGEWDDETGVLTAFVCEYICRGEYPPAADPPQHSMFGEEHDQVEPDTKETQVS